MFKRTIFIVILATVVFFAVSYYVYEEKPVDFKNSTKLEQKTIRLADKTVEVEVADDAWEQMQGLSNRDSLSDGGGMLFIFNPPQVPGFWMKDMKFSIDIIWISSEGLVVGISKNLSPETYPQMFSPPSPVKYVLEVPAHWSEKNGIKTGGKMSFED